MADETKTEFRLELEKAIEESLKQFGSSISSEVLISGKRETEIKSLMEDYFWKRGFFPQREGKLGKEGNRHIDLIVSKNAKKKAAIEVKWGMSFDLTQRLSKKKKWIPKKIQVKKWFKADKKRLKEYKPKYRPHILKYFVLFLQHFSKDEFEKIRDKLKNEDVDKLGYIHCQTASWRPSWETIWKEEKQIKEKMKHILGGKVKPKMRNFSLIHLKSKCSIYYAVVKI